MFQPSRRQISFVFALFESANVEERRIADRAFSTNNPMSSSFSPLDCVCKAAIALLEEAAIGAPQLSAAAQRALLCGLAALRKNELETPALSERAADALLDRAFIVPLVRIARCIRAAI